MGPKVSVIVAVYNAEKTLQRCLDSLVEQELTDIEIILVDDGSTDASGAICDEYVARDTRIRIVHKENEGVAATKQLGLDMAGGDYFIFLDSDDYVDASIYRKLYAKAVEDDADIVCCDFLRMVQGGAMVERHNIPSFDHDVFLDGLIDKLFGAIHHRLVRRSLPERYEVRFHSDIRYGEDKLFLVELLGKSYSVGDRLRISYVPEALHHYDMVANPGSLMKLSPRKRLDAQLLLWQAMGPYLDQDRFGTTYYDLLVKHGFIGFWNDVLDKEEYERAFSRFREGMKRNASPSSYKTLVLMACSGKWGLAKGMKWIACGRILVEKTKIYFADKKSRIKI